VTRLDAKLSPHTNADKDLYRHLKKQLKPYEASDVWDEIEDYIGDIISAVNISDIQVLELNIKYLICYNSLFLGSPTTFLAVDFNS
jgi:hypothetical protein